MFGSFHWGRPWLTRSQRARLTLERLEVREVFAAGIGQSLVFISPELAAGVPQEELAGAHVFVLDANEDAIAQVGLALQANPGASVVRVLSHGDSGSLLLAGQLVTGDTLEARAADVAGWRQYLAPDADILLYGCSVASGDEGRAFVDAIASLTGADVAASTNLTGAAAVGGDLSLEYATGLIETAQDRFADAWNVSGLTLAAPVFTSGSSTGFTTTVAGTFTAAATGSPTYSIAQKTFFESTFTTLPEPWMLTGTAAISGGACVLNTAAANQAGALILPKLGADSPGSFTATFDYTVGGGTAGDGMSFNYGLLSTTTGSATSMVSAGLTISFIESGTPKVEVRWNDVVVGSAPVTYASTAKAVRIEVDGANVLTVSYDGGQLLQMNLAGKVNAADRSDWQFAFGATTTATSNSHAIDSLTIVSNGALPTGLALDASSGVISGTATTANNPGVQAFNLVATNGDGATAQFFSLTLGSGAPVFTSSSTSPTVPGVAGTFTVAAAGATTYGVGKTLISTTLADATTLPTGAVIGGSAQFNAGALELTQNVTSQTGWLQFLGAGTQNPSSFSASFNYALGGGSSPAGNGISFLYGAPGVMTKGLRIRINENNAGSNANLVITLFKDGILTAQQLLTNPYIGSYSFRPVTLSMSDEGRVQVRVNGALAFDTSVYTNWQAADKSLWAFAIQGETTSEYTNFHTIKDLVIATNGVLPPGLTLDTSTGVISGKVGIGTSVDSYVPVTATNAAGTTVQSLKIDVSPSATLPGQRPGTGASEGGAFTLGTTGQQFRNQRAFAALQPDGSVRVWGQNSYGGAQTDAPTATGYTAITSNERSFAALKNDGSIFSWGNAATGGTGEPTGTGYVQISATRSAYAALKHDGSITVWGDTVQGGRPSVAPTGTGFVRIFANGGGFVAQRANGTTAIWGSTHSIGSSPPSSSVVFARIVNTDYLSLGTVYGAFAALDAAGFISIWGFSGAGGTSAFGTLKPTGSGWQDIVGTRAAFTAIDRYGAVSSWGDTALGSTNRPSDSGYRQVYSNLGAFVAIRQDGSLTAWGNSASGGTGFPTGTGYVQVYSTNNSFAALKADGSISVWGSTNDGNTSTAPTGTGYTTIVATSNSFAALKSDGSISVWGATSTGGTDGPTGTGWTEITSNAFAFAARKSDGSLFSWGNSSYGGTGAPTNTGYFAVQSPSLMAPYFPLAAGQPVTRTLTQSVTTQWFPGIQGIGLTHVVTSGSLPAGLTLDATTGWISGAPVQPGTFAFTVTGTSAAGTVSQAFTIKVESTALPNQRQGSGAVYTIGSGQQFPNSGASVGLGANGTIAAWGSAETGGSGAPSGTGYTQVISNNNAFAALKWDGSITAWGDSRYGGANAPTSTGFKAIASSRQAFAALKADGSITAWGSSSGGGSGAPTTTGYTRIFAATGSFAALKSDGSITAWGDTDFITGTPTGTGYTAIIPNQNAYVALKSDGSITAWGNSAGGGSGAPTAAGYTKVYASSGAYAALNVNGSLAVWGDTTSGGTSAPTGASFVDVWSSATGFAALKSDGSLVSWGAADTLGTAAPTGTGFTKVFSSGGAFAALKADGSIVSWGGTDSGGSGAPTGTGFTTVFSNHGAFAALTADGTITAWGSASSGATGVPTGTGYTQIFSRPSSFAAMKADGTVTAWGASAAGASTLPLATLQSVTSVIPFLGYGITGSVPTGFGSRQISTLGYGLNGPAGFQVGALGVGVGSVVTSGSLPSGVTLNPATGFLEGTPSGFTDSTFTVTSYNESGQVSQTWQLVAQSNNSPAAAPVFDSAKSTGYVSYSIGQLSAFDLRATGTDVAYQVLSGSLPTGMTLQSTGIVSGTPTQAGSFQFILAASNGLGVTTQGFTITVNDGTLPNQRLGQYSAAAAQSSGQQGLNEMAFAALKPDGVIVTWGDSAYGGAGAAGVPTENGYVLIAQTSRAFAALRQDGTIRAWGDTGYGGSGAPTGPGYIKLFSTGRSFAALKADGSITAWGAAASGGTGAPTDTGYSQIFTNSQSMVAMKPDGSIVAWGDAATGGTSAPTATGYVTIASNGSAFAALTADGTITAWGDTANGGTTPTTATGYVAVYSSPSGFAALRSDGTLTTWGSTSVGDVAFPGGSGFVSVSSTLGAQAALTSDGSIVAWGDSTRGGTGGPTGSGFTAIASNQNAFAALQSDGSIVAWGLDTSGGTGAPAGTGFTRIYSNTLAFVALKSDGTLVSWGDGTGGGTGAPTGTGFTQVIANTRAFAAQKADGSIVAWGATDAGGGGAPAGTSLSPSTPLTVLPFQQVGTTGRLPTAYVGLPVGSDGGAGVNAYQVGGFGAGTWYSLSSGTLPSGLSLDAATGFLSGTPLVAGTSNFTITSTNSLGTVSQAYTLEVKSVLPAVLPSQQAGAAMINAGSYPNLTAFAALATDGSITTWGDPASGGTGAPTGTGFTQVFSTNSAFAALKPDGSITAWGDGTGGGSGGPTSTGFTQVFSAAGAFAALTSDGSVFAWGNPANGGTGAPTGTGFTQVFATGTAFAALRSDGSLATWGDTASGGAGAPTGTGFTQVIATSTAFTGLRTNGSLASWGNTVSGGAGTPLGGGFTQVFSTGSAFAALKSDGSISTWGDTASGGSGGPTGTGYTQVFATGGAFAAFSSDGSITAWGNTASGGTNAATGTGYTQVFATGTAFAAMRSDGSITAWGDTAGGGTGAPASSGYHQVVSTGNAFAALNADGSIAAWGSTATGGTDAPTGTGFTQLFATGSAFAALKADGSITTWGSTAGGGTGAPAGTGYLTVQSAQTSGPAYASSSDSSTLTTTKLQSFFANLGAQGVGDRYEVTVGSLPAGLTLDASTGVVSGTATAAGAFPFTLAASNPSGTASQVFTLTVNQAPAFTSAASATFTVGTSGTFTVAATGFPAAVTYAVTAGALPSGLTLDATTGVLSGTPAAGTGGVTGFTITATNTTGSTDQSFTLTVNEAPAFTSAASATFTVGTAGTFTVAATGFPTAITYAVAAGTLPSGLSLDAATGVLSGTPAPGTGGVTNFTIRATNATGSTDQPFTLTVTVPANRKPTFTSPNSTSFVQGQSGSFTVVATGYPTPVTYRLATGSNILPAGLTLNASTGVISGTSSVTTGAYRIMLQATNGAGTTTQNLTITITAPPASAALPNAGFAAGTVGSFTSYSELPEGRVDVISGGITITSGLSPVALVARILEGRGDGTWNGTSGITSSAAAADLEKSIQRTVGWLDHGDGSVTASYAAPGDTNLDATVDILDAANLLGGGKFDTGSAASWADGDFGYDGTVDILDVADFLSTGLFDAGLYGTSMTTDATAAPSMSDSSTETISAQAAGTSEFQIQDLLGFTIDTTAVDPKIRKRISPVGPVVSP